MVLNKFSAFIFVPATLLLFSCSRDDYDESRKTADAGKLRIRVEIAGVKTTLDGDRQKLTWSVGDAITIFNNVDNTYSGVDYAPGDILVNVPPGTNSVFGLYPASTGNTSGPTSVSLRIRRYQAQSTPGVLNGANYPMAASGTVSGGAAVLTFKPAASAFALNVYKSGLAGSETLEAVRVTPTVADGYAGVQEGTDLSSSPVAFTSGNSSSPVTVLLGTGYELGSTKPADKKTFGGQIYACVAKQEYSKVKFELQTTSGLYTITSSGSAMDCVNNDFFALNINLSAAGIEYEAGGKIADVEGLSRENFDFSEESSFANPEIVSSALEPGISEDIIPDFSRVGYRYGDAEIPSYTTKRTLTSTGDATDRTADIQGAIDEVAASGGGTVLLQAGTYHVSGIIFLDSDNVVLKGAGQDASTGTVIRADGTQKRPLIFMGKTANNRATAVYSYIDDSDGIAVQTTAATYDWAKSTSVSESHVPSGRLFVKVSDPSKFSVGDRVAVYRPATSNWIADIHMDYIQGSATNGTDSWTPAAFNSYFERRVTAIRDNRIYFDNPIVMSMDHIYGGGAVVAMSRERITGSGIENLRCDTYYDPSIIDGEGGFPCDENHAWSAIDIKSAEHCWVRNVTSEHFGFSCVLLDDGAKHVTVESCTSLNPVSQLGGSRRYAFHMAGASMNLVKDCLCDEDQSGFAMGGHVSGPNVFVNCRQTNGHAEVGPHQRWTMGALFDNVESSYRISFADNSTYTVGHGWKCVNAVMWNCTSPLLCAQSPWVTGYNYAVGCIGTKLYAPRTTVPYADGLTRLDGRWFPERAYDSTGGTNISLPYTGADKPAWFPELTLDTYTNPGSLYYCQLEQRHAAGIYYNSL